MIFFRVFRHLIDLCIMSILITIVEIIVLIHCDNYMFRDQGYLRFFTYMGFLNASMLVLVTNSNLTQIYIFWELVGLCLYLLIIFCSHTYYDKS